MTKPDPNPFHLLSDDLATQFIGKNIIYYPSVSSTMDAARREARHSAPEGTVVMAGEQTGGRGRLQRIWFTPPGNLALSIILYPGQAGLPCLVMIASLAAAHAVEKAAGLEAQIKWPNDVLVGGKKVGGILIENGVQVGGGLFAVVGIGINVGLRPEDIGDIAAIATSLAAASGREVSPRLVAKCLFEEFERLYRKLPDGGVIFEAWRRRLFTLGKKVAARWGDSVIEGIAESVDADGSLLIRRADGSLSRVIAGDVTLNDK
jgi:BirA family transcriptional regulator, biotin operon repressor / biotin---[acetyl-CoA-carboxylase] ligase